MKAISVDEMGNAIAKEFEQYVDLTADEVKKIVAEVAEDVKEKIQEEAPVDTGAYKRYCPFQRKVPSDTSSGIRTCETGRRQDRSTATHFKRREPCRQ